MSRLVVISFQVLGRLKPMRSSRALNLIIGPHWAAPNEQGQPKICEESDWVRIEIEAALAKKVLDPGAG